MQIYLQGSLVRAPGPRFAGRCVPVYSIDVTVSLARNMMLLNALSDLLSDASPQPDGGNACSLMNSWCYMCGTRVGAERDEVAHAVRDY